MGSDIFIHVHWSHISEMVTGGSATWVFEVSYAKGHSQAAFTDTKLTSVVQDASQIKRQHMVAETNLSVPGGSGVQFDSNEIEVDGLFLCRIYLDSNDIVTSDSSTVSPFVHFVDLHYQSTGLPTKNKAPDFWS